jgi:hypothetical protein
MAAKHTRPTRCDVPNRLLVRERKLSQLVSETVKKIGHFYFWFVEGIHFATPCLTPLKYSSSGLLTGMVLMLAT